MRSCSVVSLTSDRTYAFSWGSTGLYVISRLHDNPDSKTFATRQGGVLPCSAQTASPSILKVQSAARRTRWCVLVSGSRVVWLTT